MATPTYELIDSTVLTSSANSVTFSSISGTGKGDLVLIINHIASGGVVAPNIRFNSDSGSNYNYVLAHGDGSSTQSLQASNANRIYTTTNAQDGEQGLALCHIMDFATDKHKTVLGRGDTIDNPLTRMSAQRWASTSAITSIEIFASANNFASGSTFHLYQIVSE